MMTSTLSLTKSAASSGSLLGASPAHRYSMAMFSFSLQAEFAKPFTECVERRREPSRRRAHQEEGNPRNRGRLRLACERTSENASPHHANERSPVHYWMISLARNNTDCGIVRPSALAVLRLMDSSYLSGCSIGIS